MPFPRGSTLTKRLFKSSSGASVSSAGDVSSDNAPTRNQQTIAGNGGVAAQSTSASHNSSNNGAVQSSTSTTNKPTSLTRSEEDRPEDIVPERPARSPKNKRPGGKCSSSRATANNNNYNNNNNSGTEESEEDNGECSSIRIPAAIKSPTPAPTDDPLEGIHSILSEMEREIRHTGVDPQQETIAARLPEGASVEPRIGGLTIEEFIHFLALLERVKEQHLDTKESDEDPARSSPNALPAERTSPYDNIIKSLGPDHPLYCNVATSPRTSPPSDEERSRSSASSSPCSSDEDAGQFQLPDKPGIPGFSFLERLFLRRYLHVIPEEVASDCGSHSARLSRALSGLSSALSYLEDADDDRFSHESIGDEYRDFASGGSLTPVPPPPTTNDEEVDPLLVPLEAQSKGKASERVPPVAHGHSAPDDRPDENADSNSPPESPIEATVTRHPSEDEFSIVLAVPVMIVDSSDYDEPADSAAEDRNSVTSATASSLAEEDGDRPPGFPQVLEELNVRSNDQKAEEKRAEGDQMDEEENQSEATSLADYCELLDESALPLSVLMMQTSGCCRDGDETGQRADSERNDPTDGYGCSCSLGFSDDDDDAANNVTVISDDNHQEPQKMDEMATLDEVAGSNGTTAVEEKEMSRVERGDDDVVDCGGPILTESISDPAGEVTVAGTSVVTLIDAKIVSVDYEPVQLICSSARLCRVPGTADTLEEFQDDKVASHAENRQLAGDNPAELETDKTIGQVTIEPTDPVAFQTTNVSQTDDSERLERQTTSLADGGNRECVPLGQGVCSSTTEKHGHVVDEMRRLWEMRCNADASAGPSFLPHRDANPEQDLASADDGSDHSTPVPQEEPLAAIESSAVAMDSVRMKSIQEFRMLWSGWPPPPPLPPPPEHYGASETETGYSTDGSEPFRQRRRRAALANSGPTPPPRPTPPRDESLYRSRTDASVCRDRRPEPPLRYQPYPQRFQPLCYYSAPEAEDDDDDERVKARLLADWLVLANRKRSQSPCSGTYRSIQRSNYSTLTSTTTTTRETSARESESEASDYNDRHDCATVRRYRHDRRLQRDDESHGSSSSLLSTPYQASSPKPGVWSPGQQQSPPERDNNHQQRQEQQQQPSSISSGTQPPIWIPSSQQPSPKSERKEFRPVRLEALKKQAAAQQQPQQREGGQKPLGGTKPAAPTSLPPFTTNTSTPASQPSASTSNAPTTYSSYLYPSSWDSQRQQNATPYGNNSANSTPINTPASEHSVLTSTSTNFSALSWDRRTNGGSTYSGGSGSTTPTPSLQPLLLPATSSTPTSHLPKVPNPTVTLLQKAREGQLPKGAAYLETPKLGERSGNRLGQPPPPQQLHRSPYEPVYSIQREYCVPSSAASAAVAPSSGDENSQQPSASQQETRKFVDLTANKFSGVGPVSNEGVPIALRSGIREEEDHHHWYRRMYESLHRTGGPGDYVTVRYKAGRGRGGGYQSEPDQNNRYDYDSDAGRYATLDRRRQRIHNDSESNGGSPSRITNHESESYRYQPGRIEDYEPGIRSSITQQQPTKQSPKISIPSKSFTNFALKESGYESDSQLIFRRRYPNDSAEAGGGQTTPATDPQEQRLWYRDIQRGGEVPLHGLRKQQPDRPQDDPGELFLADLRIGNSEKKRKRDPWRYIRFKSKSPTPPSTQQRRKHRFLSVPAVLNRLQSCNMFRSGSSKRQSSATSSPNASEERKQKNAGMSTVKTTASVGTSTSSKGKTWRRIKSGSGSSGNGGSKKMSKLSASSPIDGGFVQREESTTPLPEDISALPQAVPHPPTQQDCKQMEPLPPPPIEDMLVDNPPQPPPPPKVVTESPEVKQRSTQQRVPSRPTLPAFPAFPTLSPLQSRPAKKKAASAGSKSEPALNVYLNHRQMVSQSKFRRMQDEQPAVEETPKMTRYQKLARDTKNLVARISGEIPSTEKIRQALKLPAGGATNGNGSNGKTHSDVDVTDPEFICDEQTAAILLAELEGNSEPQKAESGSQAESVAHPPQQQDKEQEKQQQHPKEEEDVGEHYHYVVPLETRMDDGECRSSAGSPEYIKTQRFTQLRSLYRSLERLNELEKLVPTDELNQVASTDGIIDFDLWRRLRQREKAQEEMRNLATWIQAAQREGECYFGTSPPPKWQRGADPGLRIKEQSVRILADKYKTLAEAKRYATQSLPRNFGQCPDGSRAESPVSAGRVSRSSQRRSSLTGKQMAVLKSQLSRVYTPPSRYETVVSPQRAPRKLPESLLNPTLYVRSVSESSRDCTLARLEQRRNRLMESQKALSIAGVGRAVARSQSASSPKPSNISEAERRTLSMRLGAEVKERYMTAAKPAVQQQQSTRAAIQYVQQLSQHMSRKLAASPRVLSPSSPGPYRTHQSRSSSRESSASSQQDYLLVLTPRGRNNADVESAVQEWADSTMVAKTPSPTPAVPQRSSSLNIRASLDEDSHSSNSSVQTVIHRDVQKKVDFFEKVIADSVGDPCDAGVVPFRTTQSVSDLRRSASTLVGRRRTRSVVVPQRSQSLSLHRPGSAASAYGSMTDVRLSQLMDRVKSLSPSPSGRRSSPGSVSGGGSHYLNLVKKGDVEKKCQYFSSPRVDQQNQQAQQQRAAQKQSRPVTPQLSSRSVPDSLPLWSAAEKFNRNKTVIKGQEMGDVSFIKRRYEQEQPRNRFRSQFGSTSTPSLQDGGTSGSFSWSRRLAAAANKRVSFPNFSSPSRAGSRAGSDTGSRSGGKKLDFTRVKPTLLSSARLALRQAQTAADPTAHHHTIGGRMSRPVTRTSSAAGGGSYSDIPSTISSVILASNNHTTTTAGNPTSKTTVASPDMSLKSTSEGSIRSRRSMSSPLPAIPVIAANPSGANVKPTTETTATHFVAKESGSAKPPTSSKATPTAQSPSAQTPEGDYQALASSSSHTGTFDPSMHQPTYRYTPPPPRSGGRPNRINSIYDSYATYPRHRAGMQSPTRPPLPAQWAHLTSPRKPARSSNPAGAAHRFAESEVTIHYRSPIRNLQQSGQQQTDIDEEELRQMQAEHMRRVYEQERRRKYIQELEDIESRRHMDNFTPLMKSPIPLNRYDDFMDDQPVPLGRPGSQNHQQRDRTPEPKIVARGLYNFVAQNARELSFQKGDIIFIRRQIDKNWYEGEHNAMVGIFPVNYVEIIPYDGVRLTNRKASEGKGRVKFNFVAQTPVELSLVKGELVIITRQVDEHWLEGRIGQRRGIFPISYVDIIQSCSTSTSNPNVKTPTTGGNALITNGSLRSTHQYRNQQPQHFSIQPKMSPANATSQHQYRAAPAQYNKPSSLMVDTRSDPVLYRALYTYAPQNDDELELQENDMICVLEKCDDGWYVGTSQRTGLFGTFPGNYVERV
ncbi:serine/arginine repetitive matrix protein 2 isoform X5 [Daphnia magna]|uniref:serine/arginine repetitive matrix protein 2 isoform X5 n=1 Tax=Daphnia magna TaxID=35525 RepID=UPI001E1BA2E3|nr:serine/arginine repetitive matrix protein 2 isoform X5 [Daphnia magna]